MSLSLSLITSSGGAHLGAGCRCYLALLDLLSHWPAAALSIKKLQKCRRSSWRCVLTVAAIIADPKTSLLSRFHCVGAAEAA